ncbi:MAG: response regulator [Myxococcota bacterium]
MKPANARLLVVDDSPSIRELMCEVMRDLGIRRIDEASSGAAALELFNSSHYDVVVTDWNMPFMTGIELLKTIRRSGDKRDTPVLVVTANVTARRVVEAIEAGANGFIAKPFVTPALEEKVLRILASLPPVTELSRYREPELAFAAPA